MQKWVRPGALALLAAALACSDRNAPTVVDEGAVDRGETSLNGGRDGPGARSERPKLERIARRTARALRDPEFRAYIKAQLDASPHAEAKVHFQRFTKGSGGRVVRALAAKSAESEKAVDDEIQQTIELELYFPFSAHRASWSGGTDVQVATLIHDDDVPVAFDTHGKRSLLDPNVEPDTPTLVLTPVETDFNTPVSARVAPCIRCPGGNPPPPPPPPPPGGGPPDYNGSTSGGLYMTRAHFNDDFEGAFKGDPEFEIHIMGQHGNTDSLTSYQCVGAKAGAPYVWDMNANDWTGNVLLFSQTQLNNYKAQHPAHNFRIFAFEDDDTACAIKTDSGRFSELLRVLETSYPRLTGARDTVTNLGKLIDKGNAIERIVRAAYRFITTQDDRIGNALEDEVVRQYFAGANWIVRGENNVTNGYLALQMR